jgi:hypothetical protein
MAIPFTQYLRPDGRRHQVYIDRSKEVEDKAQEIIDRGHRFEVELLRTGVVSFTITALNRDDPDVAIKLAMNGPAVEDAVDALVNEFHTVMTMSQTGEKNNG